MAVLQPRLSAAPLLRELEARHVDAGELEARGTVSRRTLQRARVSGVVPLMLGDRLAVEVLGAHPADIWGDEWWEAA